MEAFSFSPGLKGDNIMFIIPDGLVLKNFLGQRWKFLMPMIPHPLAHWDLRNWYLVPDEEDD